MTSRATPILAALVLALVLAWASIHLLSLRYERGDVYPAGSSLRADPLGTKILAEALAAMPGFTVERNYRALTRLHPAEPITLAHVGIDFGISISDDELESLESLITTGTRAVFAFSPELLRASGQRLASGPPPPATPTPATAPVPMGAPPPFSQTEQEGFTPFRKIATRWGFAFDLAQEDKRTAFHGKAVPASAADALEPELPWRSALYFKALGTTWRTLLTCNGVPVLIERDYGVGTIVLCSDSFFLSNEALRDARAPRLIARVFGPPRRVVFDEACHGVTEDTNVASLARRLHLEGFVLALLAIAALFVWKNSTHFLPPRALADDTHVVGRAAGEAFITLLRRAIPPSRLLAACAEEWTKSQGRRIREEERAHVESVLRAHAARSAKDAPAAYRTIAEGLRKR